MKQRQSARQAKLRAGRRAQQLPHPDPDRADAAFRKLEAAVKAAQAERVWHENKTTRVTYALSAVAFCFGTAAAIFAINTLVQ